MNKILIVDDNTVNLDILKDALKKEYKLAFAKNGKMALKVMQKTIPDLILLDVLMPVMDGFETFEAIRSDNRLNTIPIIFLSGLEDLEKDLSDRNVTETIKHVKKPFDIDEVKFAISDSLKGPVVL